MARTSTGRIYQQKGGRNLVDRLFVSREEVPGVVAVGHVDRVRAAARRGEGSLDGRSLRPR